MPFTTREKIEEIGRELRQRANVYPRLIADRRMKPQAAERQQAILREILRDYEELERRSGGSEQISLL